jgi:hypothetical protein
MKSSDSALGNHATPFLPAKVGTPTSGGRSVGIVRLRTKSDGICLFVLFCLSYFPLV